MQHKIFNNICQIKNNKRGYTLIELLAVTAILVVVSGLIVGVLWSTLRGGSKISVTNEVAQGANYALSIISNTALNAVGVTEVGGTSYNDCTTNPSGGSIEFEKSDGTSVRFFCDAATQSIASTNNSVTTHLIDNNALMVDPATCSFKCSQPNANPYSQPIITASFRTAQRNANANFEDIASSSTSASVTMRNFNP